jgi:hypothetical protein
MEFNFRNPDYAAVFRQRAERLMRIRADPAMLPMLKLYYRDHPADFINDFGMTSDPRNVEIGLPVNVPFLLFPRQREWVQWAMDRWRQREPGATVKSRDMGVSWLGMALADTLCLFYPNMAIGVGSRKLELVDKIGDPKTLFWKARKFLELLPPEFVEPYSSKEGLIAFANGSTIAGEGGDEIGRGARTGLYLVDETASLAHPDAVDAALSQTTNCRIDISTPKGLANSFAAKAMRKAPYQNWPERRVFRFNWREDPRKTEEWYERQKLDLDPVTLAQEVDMDFSASVEGIVVPSAWVQAAIDLYAFLDIDASGPRRGALDVADEGKDANAFAASHGGELIYVDEWTGKGSDTHETTARAFGLVEELDLEGFDFDSDGLGAGVRGNARVLNELREPMKKAPILAMPFRGSAAVMRPDAEDVPSRKNKDYFQNLKAQAWWGLRRRFEHSHRARNGLDYDPAMVISLNPALPSLSKLQIELSQPTYSLNASGKIVIDKQPEGSLSPNLADAVMILMGRTRRGMVITAEAMEASQMRLG